MDLAKEYNRKKFLIKKRIREFKAVWKDSDKKVFSELCFCICTPQSKAVYCDKAVKALEKSGSLFSGSFSKVRTGLKAVRFPNNKARFIIEARKFFSSGKTIKIKKRIKAGDIPAARLWLRDNVKGLGLKEASHFLRNIGFGESLAILDVHILRNMVKCGIIREIPKTIPSSLYLELEEKLKRFSKKVNIPMAELDLLFWSIGTGEVFK